MAKRTSRMVRRLVGQALAACVFAATLVTVSHAQAYTLTDGNARLELHPGEAATTQYLSIDGGDNLVGQTGYWYGAGVPVATHAVRTLVSQPAPNELDVGYNLVNGFAHVQTVVEGGPGQSGDASIVETLTLIAFGSAWIQRVFSYNDFNLSPADQAVVGSDRSLVQYGNGLSLSVSSDLTPEHYEVNDAALLFARFNGVAPLSLTDSPPEGTPLPAPGDVAFALQWTMQVPPNTLQSITTTKRFSRTSAAVPEPGSGALFSTTVIACIGHLAYRRRSLNRSHSA